jgi:hypothetical protein
MDSFKRSYAEYVPAKKFFPAKNPKSEFVGLSISLPHG